ncbi:MAG: hypothetical protein A2W08_02560 [Candidatus Rokubacteria bacterium RBG_16_73_20]|nr:MAG: hypothetical protein A2W08_02560 [Candidatus Rokubacteria bacterium RBG_16_73_20]HBH02587.1 hypothetical protein [Candidatus Rokubacteria bacterium]
MGWQVMTGQEKAVLGAFAFLALLLVAALVLGVVRRRRGAEASPASTRFVPHWQLMGMLLLAALGIVVSLVLSFLTRR